MVNPDGKLWLDKLGSGMIDTKVIIAPEQTERVVRLVGTHINQDVTTENPIVSAELPGNGERFEGLLPPVVSAAAFTIRKGAVAVFKLDDYVSAGTMTKTQAEALTYAVEARHNIVIAGGTSSGKTTLANAMLAVVAETGDRVVILEDTRELQCEAEDTIALRTHGKNVQLSDLVRSTLRLRPDRIILEGVQTVPRALIAEAIDVIVFISGRGSQRRIETIARLIDVKGDSYQLEPLAAPSAILNLTYQGDQPCTELLH